VVSTPPENMKVSWADENSNIWKNKKCFKPPTRLNDLVANSKHIPILGHMLFSNILGLSMG
jgi:hypothetical protein